ncbi:SUKH-3 domain-containing protein [Actinoplanes sp. NPDC026619]|uniref:SUKH-3 domain-containing protein n=1 Tax=Actinoplanes sp. NPDC026619 TaxID=3155798 RepID=UPI0033CD377E
MITRGEAEEIAARWARGEAEQRGYGCEPALAEFDLGWVIWTRSAPDVLPLPGDGARTVIDRETGVLSTWPAIPPEEIAELYRRRRPKPSTTVDPWATLRRVSRRRPSPTTVAELTVGGRLFRAQGAKGDQKINHHPLVAARLGALPAAARVRGAERHAELIAVSDALHEMGGPGLPGGRLVSFLVRDPGDPDAGAAARPCETCLTVLVDLGVLPPSELAYAAQWHHGLDGPAGRFPPEVSRVLAGGGWLGVELPLETAVEEAELVSGIPAFPAAMRALAEFAGVRCGRRGPGRRRAIRLLTFDPLPAARQHRALTEFAEVIATPVFPLGTEGGDALLVIDERARVFALDQGGDWFVGENLDATVTGLLTGDGPADRLRDDGSWR